MISRLLASLLRRRFRFRRLFSARRGVFLVGLLLVAYGISGVAGVPGRFASVNGARVCVGSFGPSVAYDASSGLRPGGVRAFPVSSGEAFGVRASGVPAFFTPVSLGSVGSSVFVHQGGKFRVPASAAWVVVSTTSLRSFSWSSSSCRAS